MKLSILASGSGGNALFLEAQGTRLLVDAGLSHKELCRRLSFVPGAPSPERMDALLVTHEHSDHGGHAAGLASRGLPTFATAATAQALDLPVAATTFMRASERFCVGAIEVTPVPLPHDAADPVGFLFASGRVRVGLLTDCGHPSPEVAEAYRGVDVLILETNHDSEMLQYGSYPRMLKRRIGGRLGHLSNDEAVEFLRLLGRPLPRCLVLAHLSQMNNRPMLARAAVSRVVGRSPVRVLVASQTRVLAPISIDERGVQVALGLPGEQLALPLRA